MKKRLLSAAIALLLCVGFVTPALAAAADEIYAHNLEIYSSQRTDEAARRYYLLPSEGVESGDAEIIALAAELTADIESAYDKTRAIHDWVSGNIWYDWDVADGKTERGDQSAVGTLKARRSVCVGYANLSVALLIAAGIPAKYVEGAADEFWTGANFEQDTNHAWTEALVDGRWLIMDATWDSGNAWEGGRKTFSSGPHSGYFDISLKAFSYDHRIDYYWPPMDMLVRDGVLVWYWGPGDDIPDGVTEIGGSAFSYCVGLKSAVIPSGVTVIGSYAFMECVGLERVDIPNGVTALSKGVFQGCTALTSVAIPSSVTAIGADAFLDCTSLTSVIIPNSVTSIAARALGYSAVSIGETRLYRYSPIPGFTIRGTPGSAAEGYARENGFVFAKLTAAPSAAEITLNGQPMSFDAYNIAGNNYFKLRDLAFALNGTEKQFSVGWDGAANTISLASGQPYSAVGGEMAVRDSGGKTPTPTTASIYLNGEQIRLDAYNIGGSNYFKLRDIGARFDFGVLWDSENNTIVIDTGKSYLWEFWGDYDA
jgi:hypothetical protein